MGVNMDISELGGEFALIERLTRAGGAVVGVGDDAAVLEYTGDKYLLVTTDMLCDGDHFRRDWSAPEDIGVKAMESNVSDIAAMGGLPTYALVSISLTDDVTVEFMDGFYKGLYSVADEYGFSVVGGDTTHSNTMAVSIALLGEVEKDMMSLRSDAMVGDLICVTGDLGKSKAGLELMLVGLGGDTSAHTRPRCRLREAREITRHCNAMIDVSDGLASEVNHICRMSGVGAVVHRDRIPVSEPTRESAMKLDADPIGYALNGGEDYELVFTIAEGDLPKIKVGCPITVVGEIVEKSEGTILDDSGVLKPLEGGYNHFQ
ncbi:MAG: thiamine-phosphate kinase [Candidatus Altiarchaeales archaeon]|nr:thiamine-phosphate kinase [Candidatus Altiarchaeales archaeon]MBD3416118.1 thiamine-phosphate kinase [Candidatus Altiarchaeales archaeon]